MDWLKYFFASIVRSPGRKITNQAQGINEPSEFPSLDLAFDLTKEIINTQLQSADTLDTKANFAIGTSTAVLSAALILQSLLLPSHLHTSCSVLIPVSLHTLPIIVKRTLPFLPLLLTYAVAVLFAFRAYRASNLFQVPEPSKLLDNLDRLEHDIKAEMFRAMVLAHSQNNDQIDKKAKLINQSLLFLVLETLSLVLLVLYQVGC